MPSIILMIDTLPRYVQFTAAALGIGGNHGISSRY